MTGRTVFAPSSCLYSKTEEMPQSPEIGRGLVVSWSSAGSDGSTVAPCGDTDNMQAAVKRQPCLFKWHYVTKRNNVNCKSW